MRSSFSGLEIGKSALVMSQLGLDVTGHNIANVDTKGYTRQRIISTAYDPFASIGRALPVSQALIGQGVKVLIHDQIRSAYLDSRFRIQNSLTTYWQKRTENLSYLESFFDNLNEETSINFSIARFFEAVKVLAEDSVAGETRKLLQTAGLDLVQQLNTIYDGLIDLQESQNLAVKVTVEAINRIASEITELNKQIYGFEVTGNVALDLRDKRNLLLDDLSAIIPIEYREFPDGRGQSLLEVKIGGEVLISHEKQYELDVREAPNVVAGEAPVWEPIWKERLYTDPTSEYGLVLHKGADKVAITLKNTVVVDMGNLVEVKDVVGRLNELADKFHKLYVTYDSVTGLTMPTAPTIPTPPAVPAVRPTPPPGLRPTPPKGKRPTAPVDPLPVDPSGGGVNPRPTAPVTPRPRVPSGTRPTPPPGVRPAAVDEPDVTDAVKYPGGASNAQYILDKAAWDQYVIDNAPWAAYDKANAKWVTYDAANAPWLAYDIAIAPWLEYERLKPLWDAYNASQALWDAYDLANAPWITYDIDNAPWLVYDQEMVEYNAAQKKYLSDLSDYFEAVNIINELASLVDGEVKFADCEPPGLHAMLTIDGKVFSRSAGCDNSHLATYSVGITPPANLSGDAVPLLVTGGELLAYMQMRDSMDVHTPGIPYYIEMLNNLSRAFVQEINEVHRAGYTEDIINRPGYLNLPNGSIQGVNFFSALNYSAVFDDVKQVINDILLAPPVTIPIDPTDKAALVYQDIFAAADGNANATNAIIAFINDLFAGPAIDLADPTDPYFDKLAEFENQLLVAYTTAKNIRISDAVMDSEFNIACSTSLIVKHGAPDELVEGNNENTNLLYKLFEKNDISLLNGVDIGSLYGYATKLRFDVANTLSFAKKTADNYEVLTLAADNQRIAMSGVSLDEEMTNLIKYQHSYNGAARVITAMDEALDKLINGTGRVGL